MNCTRSMFHSNISKNYQLILEMQEDSKEETGGQEDQEVVMVVGVSMEEVATREELVVQVEKVESMGAEAMVVVMMEETEEMDLDMD